MGQQQQQQPQQQQQQQQQQHQQQQQQPILGRDEHRYVVADTNIWLKQPNILVNILRDFTNPDIIAVPWMVLHELDGLKNNYKIEEAARYAISILDQYVDHPKVWKQNPYQDQ